MNKETTLWLHKVEKSPSPDGMARTKITRHAPSDADADSKAKRARVHGEQYKYFRSHPTRTFAFLVFDGDVRAPTMPEKSAKTPTILATLKYEAVISVAGQELMSQRENFKVVLTALSDEHTLYRHAKACDSNVSYPGIDPLKLRAASPETLKPEIRKAREKTLNDSYEYHCSHPSRGFCFVIYDYRDGKNNVYVTTRLSIAIARFGDEIIGWNTKVRVTLQTFPRDSEIYKYAEKCDDTIEYEPWQK